ncbi:ABC transporter ATP-binding protein [Actinomadura welshii]
MSSAIVLDDVGKDYEVDGAPPKTALTPTGLEIRPGEFFSLVGPSGCGKTTLLNLVAGLIDPTSGRVKVGERVVDGPDRAVGIVFQRATLLRWRTVLDNVLLPARIGGRVGRPVVERAEHLLELTGLAQYRDRYPDELSGGMQQRASIARALTLGPNVLLMDEPFSALDEFTRETLNDELARIWSESPMTVLFITHNIAEAIYLSDRVGVMQANPGRLETTIEIDLERPRTDAVRNDPRFFEYMRRIRETIGHTGAAAQHDPRTDRSRGAA